MLPQSAGFDKKSGAVVEYAPFLRGDHSGNAARDKRYGHATIDKAMNFELLEKAKEHVPSVPVLVNLCSQCIRQINQGLRPMVRPDLGEEVVDTVLREIVEGKLVAGTTEFADATR